MLRKMYLVSADKFTKPSTSVENKNSLEPPLRKNKRVLKNNNKKRVHPYDKWVKFREKIEEVNVEREAMIKEIAEFLKKYYLNTHYNSKNPLRRQQVSSKLKVQMKAKLKKKKNISVGSRTRLFLKCNYSTHDTVCGEKAII